ncbi:ABC transporter ATP-binding protein [Clostridium cylindrosporum]|uniref:ABC-type antimicrobial peptide transport system, ATPase component n=1 Tax=Clostridium cylindrosporum DSM 605 TaxID=1121307 RepID=A0A0J8G5C6_CLOCY|nr:ABC-type antimicrobial peptide transport system, ATPase component [Clostridium cylindrosporum DSM 605]
MTKPIISIKNLSKVYDTGSIRFEALKDINLSVYNGEYVSIMGTSGSGKSTFMNILGCLDSLTAGEYILDGKDVTTLSDNDLAIVRNKKIGFVFQAFNLLPKLTARENVELPMVYAGIPKGERQKRAMDALRKVGLENRTEHTPPEVSGGQRQRIAIARSLVNNPSILLADEPTGNLDSKSSLEIMNIFDGLSRDGVTIVMVTHEEDIAKFTKRTVTFKDGVIISDKVR